ncbi:MAG: TIGR01777 family protein [Verrucomicrobia bacterium]|nr:TIGR01777 family protein [Verrucomicrobiota bacterium]
MQTHQRIILAGGSGFLGTQLAQHFSALGWEVVVLTRAPRGSQGAFRECGWDGRTVGPWAAELEGATAVINLTGRSVDCRYTAKNRREILNSRVDSTRVIGEAIARCAKPPRVWLNSSTATLYRHTFGPAWDETSMDFTATPEAQDAFSVEVGLAWERAFKDARTPLTRKVTLRITMVLGFGSNSVFPVLRRLARLGLGGAMGSGRQYVSWIHEADFCRAVEWLIARDDLSGPVNLAAPNPLTNAEMMRLYREVCGAPLGVGLPATEWMLEVGAFFLRTETELILKSRRVVSRRLAESGFEFHFTQLADSLRDLERRLAR